MGVEETAAERLTDGASERETDWNAVYTDHLPRIYNYFRFRLGPGVDVEDLTAKTFEKAWRARGRYRRDLAGFSTWLYRIACNVATDERRARKPLVPLEAAAEQAAAGTPESEVEHDSDLARLAALTADLPEKQRELLALKYGAGLNNRLIARLTELSESNVGTTLSRVVGKLRAQW